MNSNTSSSNYLSPKIAKLLKYPHVHILGIGCRDDEEPRYDSSLTWNNFHRLRTAIAYIDLTGSVCSLNSPCYNESLLVLRSEESLLRNVRNVMRSSVLAQILGRYMQKDSNPLFIINRQRVLFDMKDRYLDQLPTVIDTNSPIPTTLVFITRAFYQLYHDEFTLILSDSYGFRQIAIQELCNKHLTQLSFLIRAVIMPNYMYDYIYIPFITTDSRTLCHYLDIFETNLLFCPENYQILVWPNKSTEFISKATREDILDEIKDGRTIHTYFTGQ